MVVEFRPSVPGTFDANPGAENFKAGNVWFVTIITFKGCPLGGCVNEAVV
jgi:hypothetical protein